LAAMDSLIAATVLTHKFALVTRNVDDFDGTNLEIVNPECVNDLRQGISEFSHSWQ